MKLNKLRNEVLMLLTFLILSLFGISFSYAAPDPSIRDWWGDTYVNNDGDGIHNESADPSTGQVGEPSKGIANNRLFARVRNLGTTAANNVTVKFAYAPYGVSWAWHDYSDFKLIATVTGVNLGPAGSVDAEKLIEVQWDLSNLSENNGGIWDPYTVGDFDHFCVWVKIEYPGDSNTGNNDGRDNFTNIQTVFDKSYKIKFLVSNPKKDESNAELIIKGIPDNWKFKVEGIENYKRFILKPREFRLVTLTFIPTLPPQTVTPIKKDVNISLKLNDKEIIGGISFTVTVDKEKAPSFPPSGGMLSPYLIGTFDLRAGAKTILHILNPTARYLRVMVAFFDDNEKPLKCVHDKLSPNDLLEIDVRRYELPAKFGVVKVVSLNEKEDIPETGLVGYQRHFFKGMGVTETILQSIPSEILKDDLKYIWKICK
jgi:hypothetical protein